MLVMSQRRYEGACNWIADANVTFCDKGGAAAWVRSDFLQKNQSKRYIACSNVELVIGLEPTTCWLQISCSANWAIPAYPASKLTNIRIPHFRVFVQNFFKFFLWVNFQNVRTLKKRISAHRVCLCKSLCFSVIKYLLFYIFSPIFYKN